MTQCAVNVPLLCNWHSRLVEQVHDGRAVLHSTVGGTWTNDPLTPCVDVSIALVARAPGQNGILRVGSVWLNCTGGSVLGNNKYIRNVMILMHVWHLVFMNRVPKT